MQEEIQQWECEMGLSIGCIVDLITPKLPSCAMLKHLFEWAAEILP